MPTIGQLNQVSGLQPSDIIPLFVGMSQATRRATLAQLMEFINEQLTANQSFVTTQYAAPGANGFLVQVLQPNTGNADVRMIINPLADFAAGTIQLPLFTTALDGQTVTITTTKSIAALTIDLNGASAGFGMPPSLGANDSLTVGYDAPSASWYMIDRGVPSPATTDTQQTLTNKILQGVVLVAVALGQPVSGDLLNCVNLPISTGVAGLAANIALFLGNPTSARLAAALTDETGTGLAVFNNAPTFLVPRLGTPFSGILTNCTGLPIDTGVAGLAAGIALFLGAPSSANLLAAITDETGTGSLVFGTSPTLATPTINGGTINAPTINAPSFGAPVTKTAAFSLGATENMVICNGTASIPVTLPAASSAPGRTVRIKNIAAFTVTSATANVVPLAGGAAGTAILPATAGATALLVSDGANWIIMA